MDFETLPNAKYRGERLNNFFNIDFSKNNDWKGKIVPSLDKRFETFSRPVYGVRAGVILLKNYYYRYGLNTIDLVFDRYAPPNENDTSEYKRFVSEKIGIDVDEVFDFEGTIYYLAYAVINMEQGRVIVPDNIIREGIEMGLAA